jgi:hypothetical protein
VRTSRRRSVSQELNSIRRSLTSIVRTIARLAPALEAAGRAPGTPAVTRPPRKLSPERRAALKLQGQYIGHVRKLSPKQRARVKKLRSAKGVKAAIRFAMSLARP